MVRSKDLVWEYCDERGHKLYCNFCGEGFSTGITRFKYHLSREQGNDIKACLEVPDDVQALAISTTHEQKNLLFSELLKRHIRDSNIFDGVALGLLSTTHPRKYLFEYQSFFGGKYAKKTFHWFEWLPFRF
ncbi:hypothetical protein AMTRI_Chr02g258840 [Amborella trichopoda]